MSGYPLAFALIVLTCSSVYGSETDCNQSNNVDQLVECFIGKHPALSISKADIEISSSEIKRASQRINPSLDWELTEAQGASGLMNELNLMHTIELGSKRSARIKLAEVKKNITSLGYEKSYNQIKTELILALYRLRQIDHEAEVIEENQTTFRRMIRQYKRIGRMNPEQEISVNVFTMAAEEVRLKLQKLKNEKEQLLSEFEILNGSAFIPKKNLLPPIDHSWPELSTEQMNGALLREANLKLLESEKNYDLERAKSWPNLSIGPRVITTPGTNGGTFWGGALSINIPILNLNKGGREKASAIGKKAHLNKTFLTRRIKVEAKRLKNIYNNSSKTYTQSLKTNKIHEKHAKIHRMIKRGVVSPPLVIELHRQTIEFYEALHQQELEAVSARWSYYSLFSNLNTKSVLAKGSGT